MTLALLADENFPLPVIKELSEAQKRTLPFLNSQTSGEGYPLFVVMESIKMPSNHVEFNSYGLSSVSTVSIF